MPKLEWRKDPRGYYRLYANGYQTCYSVIPTHPKYRVRFYGADVAFFNTLAKAQQDVEQRYAEFMGDDNVAKLEEGK